jgi:predicted metal-binding protein
VDKVKQIVIVACHKMRAQNFCPGDTKCFIAFQRKEGEFERYKDEDASIVAIVECGECPGTRVVPSLGLLKMQLTTFNESVDVVHIGTCISLLCPNKEEILKKLQDKAGVEVIEGTHKYIPDKIF